MIRVIGKAIGESVSPEMLQQAKNLRNLATLIEGGTAVAVAYAWVEHKGYTATESTFCGDSDSNTLLGAVVLLKHKLTNAILSDRE